MNEIKFQVDDRVWSFSRQEWGEVREIGQQGMVIVVFGPHDFGWFDPSTLFFEEIPIPESARTRPKPTFFQNGREKIEKKKQMDSIYISIENIAELKLAYGEAFAQQVERETAFAGPRAAWQAAVKALNEEFFSKYEAEHTLLKEAVLAAGKAEQSLREAVTAYCKANNVKTIDDQLGASETIKYTFERDVFIEWCEANASILISRPVVIDEKAAMAMIKGLPKLPPGVATESKWSARLTKIAEWYNEMATEQVRELPQRQIGDQEKDNDNNR